jgi:hypothetical protein
MTLLTNPQIASSSINFDLTPFSVECNLAFSVWTHPSRLKGKKEKGTNKKKMSQ